MKDAFQFKQFLVKQDRSAMKVTTDACLFGAWVASQSPATGTALDAGAGTGLLSLMIAQQTRLLIDAIELDAEACEQARENVGASPWKERIRVLQGDLREHAFENNYDVIVSNPPFYERELKSDDPKRNIAHHGDSLKLAELTSLIRERLAPSGIFFLLLPYRRNAELENLLKRSELAAEKRVLVRQSEDHPYFRIMLKGCRAGKQKGPAELQELSIWDSGRQYTEAFRELLRDYYIIF